MGRQTDLTRDEDDGSTTESYSVLIIEDSKVDATVLRAQLSSDGRFTVRHAASLAEALQLIAGGELPDAITLDLSLPDSSGLDSFLEIHRRFPNEPIVILTGEHDEELAVQAMRNGAQDYVLKSSLNAGVLVRSLLYSIERNRRRLVEQRQRTVERELRLASQIQSHLLPRVSPKIAGLDIFGATMSSNSASGDFYDFIDHGDGKWDVVLADVCGHGIGPAMITVGTRRLVRSCAAMHEDLGDLMTIANRGICEDTFESLFVTLFFARVDPDQMTLQYVGAGHPAFLVDGRGAGRELATSGIPTGVDPDFNYRVDGGVELDADSIVLLMSDGVWEARDQNRVQFGKERAFELIHRDRDLGAAEIANRLIDEVNGFCNPQPIQDDMTVVIIKRSR